MSNIMQALHDVGINYFAIQLVAESDSTEWAWRGVCLARGIINPR